MLKIISGDDVSYSVERDVLLQSKMLTELVEVTIDQVYFYFCFLYL
jgi:hypothetical protein